MCCIENPAERGREKRPRSVTALAALCVTSMDRCERGNVPLTDVDKHCDRIARKAAVHGSRLERERDRREETRGRAECDITDVERVLFFFFQARSSLHTVGDQSR